MKQNINLDKLAKEYELTDLQQKFADYFVFVTGLNAPLAVELAGYKVINEDYEYENDQLQEFYKIKQTNKIVKELLNNAKVLKYINKIRKELDNQLIIDKLWVINKLKQLAENGGENTQLKATELLGKTMEMFTEKTKNIEGTDDPAKIAKEAYEKRMQNVIEFKEKKANE